MPKNGKLSPTSVQQIIYYEPTTANHLYISNLLFTSINSVLLVSILRNTKIFQFE